MKARQNPFRLEKLCQVRLRLPCGEIDDVIQRWQAFQWRGAIIGPHGSGKTRLLDAIQKHMHQSGVPTLKIFLNDRNKKIPWAQMLFSPNSVVFIDGAEQIGGKQWKILAWFLRRNRGVLITSHQEGRFSTVIQMTPSLNLLKEIVKELSGTETFFDEDDFEFLFEKHHGNVREALRECYDLFSNKAEVRVR
ncbi:MAG: hypothetical protein ACOY3I_01050 [Verrucomicrobiota bacterium]